MRPERQVDRDAAIAVFERDDHVAPEIAVRERAGEEDQGRASPGLPPSQRSETCLEPTTFHAYATYSRYGEAASAAFASVCSARDA